MSKCKCQFCQTDYPMITSIKKKLTPEEFTWIEDLFTRVIHAEFDRDWMEYQSKREDEK